MSFDFKKEYKAFYLPPENPVIVEIPSMNFLAVRGQGNPNEEGGEYKKAVELLYGVAYTIKMSYKGDYSIEGYFPYVVPPLEGLWWQEGVSGADYTRKEDFQWYSLIRLPDFVKKADFEWAVAQTEAKKKMDFSKVEFFTYDEGLCVQCMHKGPFDNEPETVEKMKAFTEKNGYVEDISEKRFHHEIYLNDPRRTSPEKLKTVIRHPIK